jgi:uncharacterized protein
METKTALITGATSGIGLELAKLFAADQYNLVIVARNQERLEETADMLKETGARRVTCISSDLSQPNSPAEIFNYLRDKEITVDILVNDAGVGEHGLFKDTPIDKELAIIQLNIVSLVHLTKLYLKEMIARGEGKILQLASVASYQPTPLLAVYAATKAFVLSFTDAVINEIEGTGVTMTALIPGATDTEFFARAGAEHTKAAKDNPQDPSVVAKVGYDALMKGEHHAKAPGVSSQIVMSSVMPNSTVAAQARKFMEPAEQK